MGPWLLAFAGGGLWGLCFGKNPLVVVPWVALVPLLLLLGQRRTTLLGFVHGLGFWLISIPWIAPTLEHYGQLPGWLAILGLIAGSSYLALYQALFAGIGSRFWRRGGWISWLGLPALWVAIEWLRTHLFNGFPWNLAGQSWVEVPGALPLAGWVGIFGISFLVVLSNVSVAQAWATRSWRAGFVTISLCLVALAVGGRWSGSNIEFTDSSVLSVRLLQPNFEIMMDWNRERVDQNYGELFSMSQRACDSPDALVIWPESAAWPYSFGRDATFRHDVERFARESCPVLLNSSTTSDLGDHNSVLLVSESGLEGQYDKHLLVPFGEYVPMSRWVPFLNQIARGAGAFSPGTDVSPLTWQDQELAIAICYEITFPEEVARQVRLGSSVLVTVTNDAWYGDSSAPWQHFHAARFRAAESRRYLVRAALTGVSAIVAPDGSVEQQLGVGERGILAADLPGARGRTLYSSAPWVVPVLSFTLVGSAIFVTRKDSRS